MPTNNTPVNTPVYLVNPVRLVSKPPKPPKPPKPMGGAGGIAIFRPEDPNPTPYAVHVGGGGSNYDPRMDGCGGHVEDK